MERQLSFHKIPHRRLFIARVCERRTGRIPHQFCDSNLLTPTQSFTRDFYFNNTDIAYLEG